MHKRKIIKNANYVVLVIINTLLPIYVVGQ